MTVSHSQDRWRVRMDWGPTGAVEALNGAAFAVVVDVLSFTTAVSVAVDAGAEVFPYRWADESAVGFARAREATLAVGRLEARHPESVATVSLSPGSIRAAQELSRLVLPSPNGSTISALLADAGVRVLAASLRNRSAVARWLVGEFDATASAAVTVIAAGERWPDGSLRPAVEDFWGAGAVIAALRDHGVPLVSPEARTAAAAFDAVRPELPEALMQCSSGRELSESGFADDVAVAAELDSSGSVPLLMDGHFAHAGPALP